MLSNKPRFWTRRVIKRLRREGLEVVPRDAFVLTEKNFIKISSSLKISSPWLKN
jgi:hypothetical protein